MTCSRLNQIAVKVEFVDPALEERCTFCPVNELKPCEDVSPDSTQWLMSFESSIEAEGDAQSEPDDLLRTRTFSSEVRLTQSERWDSGIPVFWEEESLEESLDSSFADIRSMCGEDTYFSLSYELGTTSTSPSPTVTGRKIFHQEEKEETLEILKFVKLPEAEIRNEQDVWNGIIKRQSSFFGYDADDETARPSNVRLASRRRPSENKNAFTKKLLRIDRLQGQQIHVANSVDLFPCLPRKTLDLESLWNCLFPWRSIYR